MKFLVAGLGSIGRRHLRNLVALGEKDVTLYRTHQATLSDTDLAGFPVETDLEKALALQPDAVIISNPTSLHLQVAIPAAQAGCNLLLEKPLSTDCDGLGTLHEIMGKNQKQALVGFQFRFHPVFQQIESWLHQGLIGRTISASVYWGEYLPAWHPWEDYRTAYSARKDLGGGVVLTLCHPIDYVRWLLGEVHSVAAFVDQVSDLELEVEDLAEITMKHTNGAISHIHLDYFRQPKRHSLEITGSKGSITWNEENNEACLFRTDSQECLTYQAESFFGRNDLFMAEMNHFLAILKEDERSVCSLEDGIRVQRIIAAIFQSAEQGQKEIMVQDDCWSKAK